MTTTFTSKDRIPIYGSFAKESYQKNPKTNLYGYTLDKTLTDKNVKVYFNPQRKDVIFAIKGTSTFGDVITDKSVALGDITKTRRFQNDLKKFDETYQKYHDMGYKIETTGHSLGGTIADRITRSRGNKVDKTVNFARGSGLKDIFIHNKPKQEIDVFGKGDLVSMTAQHQGGKSILLDTPSFINPNIKTSFKNELEAHNLSNLIEKTRLKEHYIPKYKDKTYAVA